MQQQTLKEVLAIAVLAVATSIGWLLAFVAVPLAAA